MFTYNPAIGLYESERFTFNPATGTKEPKNPPTYALNPQTQQWEAIAWKYDNRINAYVSYIISTSTPPPGATVINNPATPLDDGFATNTPLSETMTQSTAVPADSSGSPESNGSVNTQSTGNSLLDIFFDAAINNNLTSNATSGDALVAMNTVAGDAISGSASVMANIINSLQSAWNLSAGAFTTWIETLWTDHFGDLFLDPGQLNNTAANQSTNTQVNTSANTAINNTISLEATSGNATVSKNTQAGNAQTGDATAAVNLVNAINSSIAANQSFLGVLNIFGNLNGDILLPQNLIDTLLAANAVDTLDTSQIANSEVLGNFNNTQTITNNIDSSAISGNSTINDNTSAGNATTGDASTNVTVLNMTGRQVIGKNALLVFVNVLGEWVGVIVDAPTGTTSAALGSQITQDNSVEINATGNQVITNDIDVSARSGDATVSENTSAGDATSGDAKTAVNVLNINNSSFSLTDWFGILFINVFGTWKGSFGVDTEAGEVVLPEVIAPQQTASTPPPVEEMHAFRFTPQSDGTYRLDETSQPEAQAALASAQILGDTSSAPKQAKHDQETKAAEQSNWLFSALGLIVAASLLGTERVLNSRKNKP